MTSMHSTLSDVNRRKHQALQLLGLLFSVALVSTTFLNIEDCIANYFVKEHGNLILGVSALGIFSLSIISLVVNWGGAALQHKQAFDKLLLLKNEWHQVSSTGKAIPAKSFSELVSRTSVIMEGLIPVPNRLFAKLKTQHYNKIEISKMIGANKGASLFLIRFKLFYSSSRKLFSKAK